MTTKDVLKIVEDRGLKIVLKDGQPLLVRTPGSQTITDALLAVLKIHREWIIKHLSSKDSQ